MRNVLRLRMIHPLFFVLFLFGFKYYSEEQIPIYFSEYGITIHDLPLLGDTLNYNKSSKEDFKFVFFDNKGRCYCERYINKKIYEKGYYQSSLDTLRRYISGRGQNGKSSAIRVQKYFEPLKNGEWFILEKRKQKREMYVMGILQ